MPVQQSKRVVLPTTIATALGALLGLEASVILLIPDWTTPEGMAAGAIWGGIIIFASGCGLIGSIAFLIPVSFLGRTKLVLTIQTCLVIFLAFVIALMIAFPADDKQRQTQLEQELRELQLQEQYKNRQGS